MKDVLFWELASLWGVFSRILEEGRQEGSPGVIRVLWLASPSAFSVLH